MWCSLHIRYRLRFGFFPKFPILSCSDMRNECDCFLAPFYSLSALLFFMGSYTSHTGHLYLNFNWMRPCVTLQHSNRRSGEKRINIFTEQRSSVKVSQADGSLKWLLPLFVFIALWLSQYNGFAPSNTTCVAQTKYNAFTALIYSPSVIVYLASTWELRLLQ